MLKLRLCEAPVLRIFDPSPGIEWEVLTDASTFAMGAVLLQKRSSDTAFHPVESFSHQLIST